MNDLSRDLIYLLACAVNGVSPSKEKVNKMDLEQLYQLAKLHTVRAAVDIAVERTGVKNEQFHQAYKKAVRKNILFDIEKTAIFSEFEKNKIWYMPLKGSVIKELYSENGMREMADCDILYDINKQDKVRDIMLSRGYTAQIVGKSNHDVYKKLPVLNFELHTALFGEYHADNLYRYYKDLQRLLKRNNEEYCCHLTDEDFYIYMTAHEWKHFSTGGTGVRSLLDCYVYIKEKGDMLNFDYIREQLNQLEINNFEIKRRELAMKIFSSDTFPELSEKEKELLDYYIEAGTYGNFNNSLKNILKDHSKMSYIIHSMFPSFKYMKGSVGFINRLPILYPFGIIYRWGRILLKHRSKVYTIIKSKHDNNSLI